MYRYRIFVPGHGWTRSADWSGTAAAHLIAERKMPDPVRAARVVREVKPRVDVSGMLPIGPPLRMEPLGETGYGHSSVIDVGLSIDADPIVREVEVHMERGDGR